MSRKQIQLEQQIKLSQLHQLQQLQNHIFQQQMALINGQSPGIPSGSGLPTPAPSGEIRPMDYTSSSSPIGIEPLPHSIIPSSPTSYSIHHPHSNNIPHHHHHHSHPSTPHPSTSDPIPFTIYHHPTPGRTTVPNSAHTSPNVLADTVASLNGNHTPNLHRPFLDQDVSPLTSPWLGSTTPGMGNVEENRRRMSVSRNKRTASESGDEGQWKTRISRKRPAKEKDATNPSSLITSPVPGTLASPLVMALPNPPSGGQRGGGASGSNMLSPISPSLRTQHENSPSPVDLSLDSGKGKGGRMLPPPLPIPRMDLVDMGSDEQRHGVFGTGAGGFEGMMGLENEGLGVGGYESVGLSMDMGMSGIGMDDMGVVDMGMGFMGLEYARDERSNAEYHHQTTMLSTPEQDQSMHHQQQQQPMMPVATPSSMLNLGRLAGGRLGSALPPSTSTASVVTRTKRTSSKSIKEPSGSSMARRRSASTTVGVGVSPGLKPLRPATTVSETPPSLNDSSLPNPASPPPPPRAPPPPRKETQQPTSEPLTTVILRQPKRTHRDAEQRRRNSQKQVIDELRSLLPPIAPSNPTEEESQQPPPFFLRKKTHLLPGGLPPRGPPGVGAGVGGVGGGGERGPNKGVSKLQVLICGCEYIRVLKGRVERRDEEIGRLRREVGRLRRFGGGEGEVGEEVDLDLERDLDFCERFGDDDDDDAGGGGGGGREGVDDDDDDDY